MQNNNSKVTTREKAEARMRAEAAEITNHSKSDLKGYTGVDVDYMNYSSVARKPFVATGPKENDDTDDAKQAEQKSPEAPKAPGTTNK